MLMYSGLIFIVILITIEYWLKNYRYYYYFIAGE